MEPTYQDLSQIMTDAAKVARATNRRQRVKYLTTDTPGEVLYYITINPYSQSYTLSMRQPVDSTRGKWL